MATTVLPFEAGATAPPAGDELAKKWAQRADAAAKRLVAPGLDACDIAVERAFKAAKESMKGDFRSFELNVDISGSALNASYSYKDGRLASFELYKLPSRWVARQRVGSKTLSILVADSYCAFDLCTNDPFADGPCPGDTPE
jgi:hypothetical protein